MQISKLDYVEIIKNNPNCAYCGTSIEVSTGHSIDRVDSKKGYFKDNVVTACGHCNGFKNLLFTYEETKAIIELITAKRGLSSTSQLWEKARREAKRRRKNKYGT